MGVTQRDIAKRVGITRQAVSLALNNRPGLSDEVRAKVWRAVGELGYVPNRAARTLATRRSGMIGLIVVDIRNSITTNAIETIGLTAKELGYDLILEVMHDEVPDHYDILERLLRRGLDGVLFRVDFPEIGRVLERLEKSGVQSVFMTKVDGDMGSALDSVTYDVEKSRYLAAKHVLTLGHRKIGFMLSTHFTKSRIAGYSRALEEFGLRFEEMPVIYYERDLESSYSHHYQNGYQGAKLLIEKYPDITALITLNDLTAIGAMRGIYESGRRIPEDIAVVGHDNVREAAFCRVPLTTVNQPTTEVAQKAVEMLDLKIRGKWEGPKQVILEPELVIRESCGALRGMRNEE